MLNGATLALFFSILHRGAHLRPGCSFAQLSNQGRNLGAADEIGFPFTKLDCEDGGETKPRDSVERREELMMSDDSRREIIPARAPAPS